MRQAILKIRSGPLAGQSFVLPEEGAILGRGSESTLPLHEYEEMSRKHARIYKHEGNWVIEDLKSTNGITLNGKPVTVATLATSSILDIGGMQAEFLLQDDGKQASGGQEKRSSNTTYLHKLLAASVAASRQQKIALGASFTVIFILVLYVLSPKPDRTTLPRPVELRVQSGVVFIACVTGVTSQMDGNEQVSEGVGTGFLIGGNYILTNRHVVTNEETAPAGSPEQTLNCMVTFFSGTGHEVSIPVPAQDICTFAPANDNDVGQFDTDLALIKLPNNAPEGAAPLTIGHTTSIHPSDRVFMEGFPEGGGTDLKETGNVFNHAQINSAGYLVVSPYPDPETQPHDVNELERDSNQHVIAVHMSGSGVAGDSGSPIVDSAGDVIAIHRGSFGASGTILKVEIPTAFIRAFIHRAKPILQQEGN